MKEDCGAVTCNYSTSSRGYIETIGNLSICKVVYLKAQTQILFKSNQVSKEGMRASIICNHFL